MPLRARYRYYEGDYPVKSLRTLSIEAVISSLNVYVDSLQTLPRCLKSRLLRVCTTRGIIGNKELQHLVHPEVTELDLSECVVSNETFGSIAVCISLWKLDLNPGRNELRKVSTQGLVNLFSRLQNLSVLFMQRCSAVTDEVVCSIVDHCQLMKHLDLGGCSALTDLSLQKLKNLKNLTTLNISYTQVTDEGVQALVEGPCSQTLTEILLETCPGITDVAIENIVLHCPKVNILIFRGCPVTDAAWAVLEQLSQRIKQISWTVF